MVMKEFTLPSGLKVRAPQMVETTQGHRIVSDDSSDLKGEIVAYAIYLAEIHGISSQKLHKIIECESNFNPKALNPKDIDGRPKFGLMQFDSRTFIGENIWDWREQLEVAVKLMAKDGFGRWPACSR